MGKEKADSLHNNKKESYSHTSAKATTKFPIKDGKEKSDSITNKMASNTRMARKEKPKIPIKDGVNVEKYEPVNRALKGL